MITRYRAWMDNRALDEIAESIYITDIKEKTPKMTATTAKRIGGKRLLRMERENLQVIIRLMVREYDPARRKSVMGQIRAWASEGYLSLSDRPARRIWVTCEKLPSVDSSQKWSDEVEMTLTAYDVPYWEDEMVQWATCSGTSGTAKLHNLGDMDSPVGVTVAVKGNISTMTLTAGEKQIRLTGLSLAAGSTVTLTHDERGLLSIMGDGVSLLSKRTADSADDLSIPAGVADVGFAADGNCTVTYSVRGRYL